MADYTLDQLGTALRNADAAGDVAAATAITQQIKAMQQPKSMLDKIVDTVSGPAKAIGSGLAKGAEEIAGIPGTIQKLTSSGMAPTAARERTGVTPPQLPTEGDINAALPQLDYEPKTPLEKYLKSGSAGVSGMALSGGTSLPALGLGALSGVGGQVGADATQNSAWGRLLGSVAGLAPGAVALRTPQIVKAVQGFLKETPESDLLAAAVRQQGAAKTLGTPVLLNQGMENPGPLAAIATEAAKSAQGPRMQRILNDQLPAGEQKIDQMIAETGGQNPSQGAANQILEAGKKVLQEPRTQRTQLTADLYNKAAQDTVPPDQLDSLAQAVRGVADRMNLAPTSDAGKAVARTASQIKGAQPPDTPAGMLVDERGNPLIPAQPNATPVLQVNSLAREKAKGPSPLNPTSKEINAQEANKAVAGVIKDSIAGPGTNLGTADQAYSDLSQGLVKPYEESALTSMFPGEMRTAQYPKGDYDVFSRIFDSTKYGPKDIQFAAANLNRADPQAWPSIVKQHLMAKLDDVSAVQAGRPAEGTMGDFASVVRGTSDQSKANFDEMMRGVAQANGKDPNAVVQGANRLLDALQIASRERGVLGQGDVGEFERLAGANPISGVTRGINFIQPLRAVGRVIERTVRASTYKKVVDALTTPEGVNTLLEIKNYSPTEALATLTARAGLTVGAVQQAGQ